MSSGYIAIDLGAESGRVVIATLDDGHVSTQEVHRFPNSTIQLPTGLHWDVTGLWREICAGLTLAAQWSVEQATPLVSVGVDTWGVDWALVDASGELLGLPHAYRDPRNHAAFDYACNRIGPADIYQATGIQVMPINTLFSLVAQQLSDPGILNSADRLFFIPDLFNYWLSGSMAVEATIASTSQMIDSRDGTWNVDLLDRLELPSRLCKPTVSPGTRLGRITPELAADTGLSAELQVIATASHDTASAVAAVPATSSESWCYLSSGTWSLLGAELKHPCITDRSLASMFTNEAGFESTVRFLKNIAGLWLVQQCRSDFAARGDDCDYEELTQQAKLAEPFRTVVDPDHPPFQSPGNILKKVDTFANRSDQPQPETPGDYVRCCLESLALAYHQTLGDLERTLDRRFDTIHVVGGGGRNNVLNQMTADATQRKVVVGPFEATAIGNALIQAVALGHLADLRQLRETVYDSVELQTFSPSDEKTWREAFVKFLSITGR